MAKASEEILTMVHAFGDAERRAGVRALAARVADLEDDQNQAEARARELEEARDRLHRERDEAVHQLRLADEQRATWEKLCAAAQGQRDALAADSSRSLERVRAILGPALELDAKATPAPWVATPCHWGLAGLAVDDPKGGISKWIDGEHHRLREFCAAATGIEPENAYLIAALRNALPELRAALEGRQKLSIGTASEFEDLEPNMPPAGQDSGEP